MGKLVTPFLFIFINLLLFNKILTKESHVDDVESNDLDYDDDSSNSKDVTEDYVYSSPVVSGFAYLAESFDDEDKFNKNWIKSQAKKEDIDEDIAKYDGTWSIEEPLRVIQEGNLGLVLKLKARHSAISTFLNKPFNFQDKPLIVQYEVNFQQGQECGGAYLKLLTNDPEHQDLNKFHDKTPYTIMFGPDKCGNNHKLHFIFRHKNPLNSSIEEKHCKKPKDKLDDYFKDKSPHLYTLIVRPDNTFQIKVDNIIVNEGSLLDDFTPPVNPPLEIEDPNDKRPEDWDDREKIPDPSATIPDDWDEDAPSQIVDETDKMPDDWLEDEPLTIPNPDAVKPNDWDPDMDGDWEPPQIPNPKCPEGFKCGPYKQKMVKNPRYKGKWMAPLIDNPNYKGKWKPRLIHNPDFFNDEHPFKMMPIHAVGFELWSMSPDILFDNLIITDDEDVAKQWAADTFEILRKKSAQDGASFWGRMMRKMNNKPGWWAIYFIYCSIPVICYIWYLCKRSREWSWWRQFVNFTSENPWIWAVYIIIAGLPILLLVYCCCFSSQEKQDTELLNPTEDINEQSTDKPEWQSDTSNADNEPTSSNEIEEFIDNEKDEETTDGPRRRKPNIIEEQ